MNKIEMIEEIVKNGDLSKSEVEKVLNSFINLTIDTLKKGDKVVIAGFGTFEVAHRAARVGINPSTKAKINIEAKNSPKFKPSKSFKEAL